MATERTQEGPQGDEAAPQPAAAAPIPQLPTVNHAGQGLGGMGAAGMTVARVMQLQSTAGNAAVAKLLRNGTGTATAPAQPGGPGSAIPQTTRAGVEGANDAIYMDLAIGGLSSQERENVLRQVLLHHDKAGEMKADYQARYHRDLVGHIQEVCGDEDALRADEYLEHGRLRAVAKILLTIDGAGTSDETLFRVLPEAYREGDAIGAWDQLKARPLNICRRWADYTLDAALDDDLDGGDLDKARALVRFGRLRPVDKVRVAVEQAGTDEALLFDGLRTANRETIKAEYEAEYHENLEHRLFDQTDEHGHVISEGELSGEDAAYAQELLGTAAADPERLLRIVRVAVTGAGTNTDMIWQAVEDVNARAAGDGPDAEAARAQKQRLRQEVEDPNDPLGLTGVFGDLSDADNARLRALLGIPVQAGDETVGQGYLEAEVLNDPHVQKLRGMGGVDNSSTFETVLKADKPTTEAWAGQFANSTSPLHRYLWQNVTLNSGNWNELTTVFNGSLYARLRLCAGGMRDDYEDYALNLVKNHASPAERLELRQAMRALDQEREPPNTAAGRAMAAVHGAFSWGELTPIREALQADSIAVLDRAEELEENIERETSWWYGPDAGLEDERRELATGRQRAGLDAQLSAAEETELRGATERTAEALQVYIQLRDQYTDYASQAVSFAAGILITAATGGAAGPVVLGAVLRAALASAIARVVTEKALRGDRMDLTGEDGVRAFLSGAVDGAMNVIGAPIARGAMGAVAGAEVRAALAAGNARFGVTAVASAIEGAAGGAAGGVVDSVVREDTWRQGVQEGLGRVINASISSAGQGAAISVGVHGATSAAEGIGSRLRTGGPDPDAPTTRTAAGGGPDPHATADGAGGATATAEPAAPRALTDSDPVVSMAREGQPEGVRAFIDEFERWETAVQRLQSGEGKCAQMSPEVRREVLARMTEYRRDLLAELDRRFGARPKEGASTEAGSDADLNIAGADAGAKYLEARRYLDQNHRGWDKRYRMALLIDSSRVQTVQELLAGLPPAQRVQVEQRVAQTGETFSLARQIRRAEPAERAQLIQQVPEAQRARVQQLVDMDDAARRGAHDRALLDGDALARRLAGETDPAERLRLATELTEKQMYANMLNEEAYITPGAVGRFVDNQRIGSPQQRYQAAIDQIDMISHQVHEHGGVLAAMRSYEIFKYIRRFCEMAEGSGRLPADDAARLSFFRNWAEYVYRVEREATSAQGGPRRLASTADQAEVRLSEHAPPTREGVPDAFLLDNYADFQAFADRISGRLREQALGESGGTGGPLVTMPRLTDADRAALAAGPRGTSTPAPASGNMASTAAAARGSTPTLGTENHALGNPVGSERDARMLVQRLAAGDTQALSEIGVTPPPGYDPRGREWGIGRNQAGQIVIVEGGRSAVDWDEFLRTGGRPLAHSHPLTPGRRLQTEGRTIVELIRGTSERDLDAIHVMPSVEDFMFVGRHGLDVHDVHTPYVHMGGGRIGNPDPASTAPQPTLSFRMNDTTHVGNLGQMRIWRTMLIAYDSAGTVIGMHTVYVGDSALLNSITLAPPEGMVPVAPRGGTGAAAGTGEGEGETR